MSEFEKNGKKLLIFYSIIIFIVGLIIGFFIGKSKGTHYSGGNIQTNSQITCKTCKEISTCEEAKKYLAAGCNSLDKDKDGIPCESLCKK